jgi:hypothetical protein
MATGVWIYFDLGINGDYEGMYSWLDDHDAHACGDRLAFVRYKFGDNLFEELKADILNSVDVAQKNHIYVIFKDEAGNVTGKFLVGRRMRAPWVGYGSADQQEAADVS